MNDDDLEEYQAEIKRDIDTEFGSQSRYLSNPEMLVGRWKFQFRDGSGGGTQDFLTNGSCRAWLEQDGEPPTADERWKLAPDGWLSVLVKHEDLWYADNWRVYQFDHDRIVLANADASVVLEYVRMQVAHPE